MPVSVLEAFACGLPIVSTDVGGIPYLIKDRKNGLLIKSNDHKSMAKKIIFLLEHQDVAHKLIKNGQRAVGKYNWESVKRRWQKIYATR
jgi:glycosyltransferase involved in cell wall biosynthesis